MKSTRTRMWLPAGLFGALLFAGACGHVNQEAFDTEMASIRAEMADADDAVEARLGERIDDVDARTLELARRLDTVEGDLRGLQSDFDVFVERTENALRLHTPVHFEFDDATVRSEDEELLNRIAGILEARYPTAIVTVEGFTDPSGPAEYNLKLGQRRADSVREFLVTHSFFTEDQVRAVSYGEDTRRLVRPDASGPGAAGMENRRVVVVIDHENAQPATAVITDPSTS